MQIDGTIHGTALGTITAANSPYTFSFPWTITGPGTYEVKVTGRHGNEWGEDSEVVVVSSTMVIVDYPAAPAVANQIIREHMPRLSRNQVNFLIREVAHKMGDEFGRGTDFNGVPKSDVALYKAEVMAFMLSFFPSHP